MVTARRSPFTVTAAQSTTLHAPDGVALHAVRLRTHQTPKACVLIVHGIGEHSGRYAHVAAYLNRAGYTVYSLDYRGHGLSEGKRANVGEFALAALDVKMCYDWLRAEEGDLPVFILGHSQGTLVTLVYALRYPQTIRGIVLLATMMGLTQLPPPLIWLARILKLVAPESKLIKLDANTLSHSPDVLRAMTADPLNNNARLSSDIVYEMLREGRRVLPQLPALKHPILLAHGTGDQLTPPAGSQLVFETIGSTDKQLFFYEDLYHELHNEPEQNLILADIAAWLDAHTQADTRHTKPAGG